MISGVISLPIWVMIVFTLLIPPPLITAHEPPSKHQKPEGRSVPQKGFRFNHHSRDSWFKGLGPLLCF